MRVKFNVPSALDVENVEFDSSRGELSMDLIFYGSGKEGIAGVVQVFGDDGNMHFRGLLKVSGQTGKPTLQERTDRVVPPLERPGA
jgi:hypothetical protein